MTDHPSTFRGDDTHRRGISWDDRAALHRRGDGDGLLEGATALRRGTFAEMIRHVMLLPEQDRGDFVIEKLGDREFSAAEAVELSQRPDFPASAT